MLILNSVKTINYIKFVSDITENRSYQTLKKWAESIKVSMKCRLLILDLCAECFKNYNKEVPGFTSVCNLQHKVVWAKCGNRPYWPAKVLKEDENWAFVQYFGTYSVARVQSNSIIDISEQNPNKAMNDETLRILQNCTRVRFFSNVFFGMSHLIYFYL